MTVQKRFYKELVESGCIPAGTHLLVAVSGGADSVALLSLLHGLAHSLRLKLEAAHLDHALRDNSQADADSVVRYCRDLGIPVTVKRQDVGSLARQRQGNLEEVARDARRAFLVETAQERGCRLIALGHHADDQAETFLMRLLRGAGTAGLVGMRPVEGCIVRPLLAFHHDELVDYLEQQGLAWREDETNRDQTLTRNRIRHELLPLLKSFNPKVVNQISNLCEQLRADEDVWSQLAGRTLCEVGSREADGYRIQRAALAELPPALAGRVARAALREVRGNLRGITATHIASLLQMVDSERAQGELHLPGAWVACRYDQLHLRRQAPALTGALELILPGAGCYPLPDGRILELSESTDRGHEASTVVEFDATTLTFPLLLRHCLPGDRIRPSGMDGTKKLQDLFVDLKMTREDRQKTLLLLKDQDALWVVGLRRCEGWRPVPGKPILRASIKPPE